MAIHYQAFQASVQVQTESAERLQRRTSPPAAGRLDRYNYRRKHGSYELQGNNVVRNYS